MCFITQQDGAIAQLVEQRTENPCVPGSIPGGTTEKRELLYSNSLFWYKTIKEIQIRESSPIRQA